MFKLVLALFICFASSAQAHHSRANFDRATTTLLTGKIVDYQWKNPHVFIEIKADKKVWLVEAHSVTAMRRNGWAGDSLAIGESVAISGSPDKDPSKNFVLLDYVEKSGGNKLYAFRNPKAAQVEKVIEPSADFSGTWSLDMRRFSLNLAGGGPPKEWQYTAEGRQLVDGFSVDQNPELQCNEIGVPRISIYPYGTNFYRDGDSLRIVKEHMDEKRTVWFDKDAEGLQDQAPSYVGTSYGYFKSDRHLVIETNNFLPTRWGSANGVDSSAQKSVIEEYALAEDGLTMELTVTITDPVYLAAPGVSTAGYIKDESREFVESGCDPNAASRHLSVKH